MIHEILTTPTGWLLLFALLFPVAFVLAAVAELARHIRIPRPHVPGWFPRPVRYWLPVLVSYALIAWMTIRVDVCEHFRPPADMRRDRH